MFSGAKYGRTGGCYKKSYNFAFMIKKYLISLMVAVCALSMSAQIKSITDCQQIALAKDAEGNNVMFYFIPTRGKLEPETFITMPQVLLIKDVKGTRIFNTETFELMADVKPEVNVFKVSNDGYLAYTDNVAFSANGQVNFYGFDGKKIWKVKDRTYLNDPVCNVLVCKKKNVFTAFEMSTGKSLWENTISHKFHNPLCNCFVSEIDKSNIYMIADSLIRLNFRTGEMIVRPFRAGMESSGMWGFGDSRIRPADRALMEESYNSIGRGYSMTGLHSNWIERGDSLFVADADSIYCLDHNLRDLWKTPLPAEMGAKSVIKYSDGKIYLQNFGIAFHNGYVEKTGKPFGAVYAASDGRRLSLTVPGIDKKLIGGCYTHDGRVYWQTNKKFFYSDEGDSTATEIKWKPKTSYRHDNKCPDFVICDTVYVVKDGFLQPVVTDKSHMVVEIYGKDVNIVEPDGQIQLMSADEVYFHDWRNVYSTNRDKSLPSQFVIIDPATRKIEYSFYIKGVVYQDRNENIIVRTPQGVGFLKKW